MTKSEGMTKHEIRNESLRAEESSVGRQNSFDLRDSEFVIVSSFVIRHSSFSSSLFA